MSAFDRSRAGTLRGRLQLLRARMRRRPLPDFLILGGQRCGTTSLFRYLTQCPMIDSSDAKEVHFFDRHWQKGEAWYRYRFPPRPLFSGGMSGEATPCYLFHPLAPERVAETVPNARLIVLLRDPVERAWSHYQHEQRNDRERRPFFEAIQVELTQYDKELQRVVRERDYWSEFLFRHSYLHRGVYADQLQRWAEHVPLSKMLILQSEEFFARPSDALRDVFAFLGLPTWEPPTFEVFGPRRTSGPPRDVTEHLRKFFAPHNRRLDALLDRRFSWPSEPDA